MTVNDNPNPSLEEAVEAALRTLHLVMDMADVDISDGSRQALGILAMEALQPLEKLFDVMPSAVVCTRADWWAGKSNAAALRELADKIERYEGRPIAVVSTAE